MTPPPILTPKAKRALRKAARHAKRMEEEHAARDAAMVEARREGASLRQIGAAVGMSQTGPRLIVQRAEAALEIPEHDPA